jgi:hypothetical protein
MRTTKVLMIASLAMIFIAGMTSCKKYRKYDNMEVIENSYTGNVIIGSTGAHPGGDFQGNGDSGEYSFAWENNNGKANANFDITGSGTVQLIIYDAKGKEVLNGSRTGGQGEDSFSGVSEEGKKGKWKVSLIFTNFNGSGSFSVSPGS